MGKIAVGDTVAYTREWLRSIGAYTGNLPFARGKVLRIDEHSDSYAIATVEWSVLFGGNGDKIPPRVNVRNLVNVESPAFQRSD